MDNYQCECGSTIKFCSKYRHERSVKHKRYILEKIKKLKKEIKKISSLELEYLKIIKGT